MQKSKKDGKGKGKTDMTKIKCYNCGEVSHFAWNFLKPRENANIAQESEQNRKFGDLMDFGDKSVCEECAIVGSHQVPFPMCTLETLQKYCSTGSLLLTFC